MARTRHRSTGFSLIELVTVIVIIGVLAAFAVPKLATSFSGFEQYAFRQDVLTAVRYAQKTASAASCEIQVKLDASDDEVTLTYDDAANCGDPTTDNFNEPVPDPTGGDPTGGDFTVTPDPDGAGNLTTSNPIVFDHFGGHRSGPTNINFANADTIEVNNVTGYVQE